MYLSITRPLSLILLLTGLTGTGNVSAATAEDKFFKSGIAHFQKKDYAKALAAFKNSYQAGKRTASLQYNIGVCHYKLGQYAEAEAAFKKLRINKRYRQIADYNLGLIANKQNKKKSAAYWFKKSIVKTGDAKINRLAENVLASLTATTTDKKPIKNTVAHVMVSLGSDDNVTLSTNDSPSQSSDQYTELFAYGEMNLTNKYILDGSYHRLDYFDINAGDFQQARLGIRTDYAYDLWQLTPHLQIAQSRLTDGSFQRHLDFKFSGKRKLDNNRYIKLRYRYTDIDSLNPLYDYLQGDRQQFRADYFQNTELGQLRLRYELELNDRQNLTTANYSPTRHAFRARLKHRFINQWVVYEELRYRMSRYDSANGITREDDRLRLNVNAEKKLDKNLSAGGRLTYTDNDSSVAAEKYTRTDLQLYLDYTF